MKAGARALRINPLVLVCLGLLCVGLAAALLQWRQTTSPPKPEVRGPSKMVDDPASTDAQDPNPELEAARARSERAEALRSLKARFKEEQLKDLAIASEELEASIRSDFGDAPELYEALKNAWAEHCEKHKITEIERDALEDEALRRGWLPDRE